MGDDVEVVHDVVADRRMRGGGRGREGGWLLLYGVFIYLRVVNGWSMFHGDVLFLM